MSESNNDFYSFSIQNVAIIVIDLIWLEWEEQSTWSLQNWSDGNTWLEAGEWKGSLPVWGQEGALLPHHHLRHHSISGGYSYAHSLWEICMEFLPNFLYSILSLFALFWTLDCKTFNLQRSFNCLKIWGGKISKTVSEISNKIQAFWARLWYV